MWSQRHIVNTSYETSSRKITYIDPCYCLNSCHFYCQRNILLFNKPPQNNSVCNIMNLRNPVFTLTQSKDFYIIIFSLVLKWPLFARSFIPVANICIVFLPDLAYLCLLNAALCEEFSNGLHWLFYLKWSIVIQHYEIKIIRLYTSNILQVCQRRYWFITELISRGKRTVR
jgi:hypothetical protein